MKICITLLQRVEGERLLIATTVEVIHEHNVVPKMCISLGSIGRSLYFGLT